MIAFSVLAGIIWSVGVSVVLVNRPQVVIPVSVDTSSASQAIADTQRQSDVNALDANIEAYYALSGFYPTVANMHDTSWISHNMSGLPLAALSDPATNASYAYSTTPANCDNASTPCKSFTISATLSNGSLYQKRGSV